MKKDIVLEVDSDCALMAFLTEKLPCSSRKEIKALLTHKSVVVGGKIRTQYDFPLRKGQKILIDYNNRLAFLREHKLEIIHEDEYLIAIVKPAKLLSVADGKGEFDTVFTLMNRYAGLSGSKNKIHIVHRLDRETSGVMVVAKSFDFKNKLQDDWSNLALTRKYYAVTEGVPEKKTGTIRQNLVYEKNALVHGAKSGGETAVTEYSVIKENGANALLDIEIKTGKKNQIRAAMRSINTCIAGDKKYGAKTNPIKRLGLHAYRLELKNPLTGEVYNFTSAMPKEFNYLFKERRRNED